PSEYSYHQCNINVYRRTVVRFRVTPSCYVAARRLCSTSLCSESWRRPTLPRPRDRSTIGADRLNDRVRDGNGCGPVALVASKNDDNRRVCGAAEAHLETEKRSSLTGN